MDNLLVRFSKNGLKENQAYLKAFFSGNVNNFAESEVKDFCKSFLNQAIEFSEIQINSTFETKPLLQFYSLLNLVKFSILFDGLSYNIQISEINEKFKTHGASSKDIDEVTLNNSGVAIEFAHFLNLQISMNKTFTLLDLYKRSPDCSFILNDLQLTNDESDFKKIEYPVDYCFSEGKIIIDSLDLFRTNSAYENSIISNYNSFTKKCYDDNYIVFNINEAKNTFLNKLKLDVKGNYYLDTNQSNEINELFAIYLIFLKYSSLSRYKPNEWYKKLNSKEIVIIEYTMDNLFEKFWSLIAKKLCNFEKCIL